MDRAHAVTAAPRLSGCRGSRRAPSLTAPPVWGWGICLGSSWHTVGSSSKTLLMSSWGCCTQLLNCSSFREGTDSAHPLSSCRDLASDMDLHAKDKNATVLTPSLCNETPSTLLLMYKERD